MHKISFQLFVFICFIAVSSSKILTFSATLNVSQVYSAPIGFIPPRTPGQTMINMYASNDIQICIQEFVELQGSLQNCNSGGYFNFTTEGKTMASLKDASENSAIPRFELDDNNLGGLGNQEFSFVLDGDSPSYNWSATTNLRSGTHYFVSVAFVSAGALGNSTFTLQIVYVDVPCPQGMIASPVFQLQCLPAPVLPSGIPKNDSVAEQGIMLYNVTVPDANNNNLLQVVVDLRETNYFIPHLGPSFDNGSYTVSIRRGNTPTPDYNDGSASYAVGQPTIINIEDPLGGFYFLEITNTLNVSIPYTLNVALSNCPANLYGPFCNATASDLTNQINVTTATGTGFYQFYQVLNKGQLVVGTASYENSESIAPPIVASFLNYPTNDSNMFSASNSATNYLFATTNMTVNWFIAVTAAPGENYYIWANTNCPNDCQGENFGNNDTYGSCDTYTGICNCNSHYGNLTCTRTGLAVVWIVLIAIAAAIVLAIAIGVPVACYLRNRNRSRYERV